MAAKRVKKKNLSETELFVRKLSAGLFLLAFIVISLCVIRLEASPYHLVKYIIFDSFAVFFAIVILRWIISKVLVTYQEMDGGQG